MKGELIALLAPDCNQFFRKFCWLLSKLGGKKRNTDKGVTPCLQLLFVGTALHTCPEDFCNPSLLSVKVSITAVTDGWAGEDDCWSNGQQGTTDQQQTLQYFLLGDLLWESSRWGGKFAFSINRNNFYHTDQWSDPDGRQSFECFSDQSSMNLSPFLGHPSGTGFTANQRPVVFYRPSLDHVDNPQFG